MLVSLYNRQAAKASSSAGILAESDGSCLKPKKDKRKKKTEFAKKLFFVHFVLPTEVVIQKLECFFMICSFICFLHLRKLNKVNQGDFE